MLDATEAFDKTMGCVKLKVMVIFNDISFTVTEAAERGFFSVDVVVNVGDFNAESLMECLSYKLTHEYGYRISCEENSHEPTTRKLTISWDSINLSPERD